MLRTRKVTDAYNMEVYVETGELFGTVEEGILTSNKVSGWRVRATRNSILGKVLGGAKGVIVPHQLVRSIGDVMIISKAAIPSYDEPKEQAMEEA
jgi:sporulation protein YlmC with PRC-barrel domain